MINSGTQARERHDLHGFSLGDVIDGRYELRRFLGSGAEAVVFEALHRFTGQRLAIKLLSPPRGMEQARQRRARMLREATVLGQVRHPNVVTIFDARIAEDCSYLVLELLEGRTLESLLAARGTLNVTDAVSVALQVCDALAVSHRRKIFHRDLKPANILVVREAGVGERVKLVDFGASLVERDATQPKITAVGALVGTPAYMAPEQLLAEDNLDGRVDVYALGAVLFECLTGRVARPGNYNQILKSVYTEALPSLRQLAPTMSPALATTIQRAMATERGDRHANVERLAQDLATACAEASRRTTALLEPPRVDTRRRVRRALYSTPVRVVTAGGVAIDGRSQDISEGGMLFQARQVCTADEVVDVRFGLPTDGRVVTCRAHVRWVRGEGPAIQTMGLEFAEIPASVRDSIRRYVSLMSPEPGDPQK